MLKWLRDLLCISSRALVLEDADFEQRMLEAERQLIALDLRLSRAEQRIGVLTDAEDTHDGDRLSD